MSEEQSWGADTVVFGRAREPEGSDPGRRRPPRGPRRRLPFPALRVVAAVGLAIVALVALVAVLGGGGSDTPKAPIRAVADPAPRVVVTPPTRMRRREPRRIAKPHFHRRAKGHLEGKREPKVSAATHELDEPEPMAEAVPEPIPEAEPVPEAEPAPPAPPAPTSPAAEFGL